MNENTQALLQDEQGNFWQRVRGGNLNDEANATLAFLTALINGNNGKGNNGNGNNGNGNNGNGNNGNNKPQPDNTKYLYVGAAVLILVAVIYFASKKK